MAFRFFAYWSSGTCWPVALPGKQASLAPKKTVYAGSEKRVVYDECSIGRTMNLRRACSGVGMKPGSASIALAVL